LGILDVEQEFADTGRLHLPQDREIDIDDILVAGEHQALFRYITHGGSATADIVHHPHADIDLVHAQGFRREHRLNRIRQRIIESRLHLADFLAEAQHDTQLIGLDPEKAGKSPQREYTKKNKCEPAPAEIAPREHATQSILAPTEDFLQIRRR